jgi:hypothetical protein
MCTREPNLFHICFSVLPLFTQLLRRLLLLCRNLILDALLSFPKRQPIEETHILLPGVSVLIERVRMDQMPGVGAELGAAFIERERMPKGLGYVIVDGEREHARDKCTNGRHGVETTNELNLYGAAEGAPISCSVIEGEVR